MLRSTPEYVSTMGVQAGVFPVINTMIRHHTTSKSLLTALLIGLVGPDVVNRRVIRHAKTMYHFQVGKCYVGHVASRALASHSLKLYHVPTPTKNTASEAQKLGVLASRNKRTREIEKFPSLFSEVWRNLSSSCQNFYHTYYKPK